MQLASKQATMGEAAMKITTEASRLPHVLLVSFPGQGHVNPLLRLAKRIAAKGLLVTFSSTSDIGNKMAESMGSTPGGDGVAFGRGRLRFEFLKDGSFTGFELGPLMQHLETVGPVALADLIKRQEEAGRPVSCVINNPFIPWVVDVATDAGIPSGVLWVQSCAVFSVYYHYNHSLADFPTESNPDTVVMLPGLPPMKPEEIPSFLLPTSPYKVLTTAILAQFQNLSKATWVFANSFEELERDAIAALANLRPLIPVGPLIELDDDEAQSTDSLPSPKVRGDIFKAADECIHWLDTQEPESVLYVSLGSVVILTKEETAEMAYGLQSTGRPFLWVVRPECRDLLPAGFLEQLNGKGMVVGWSPQDRVLAHRAVACFLTHCGWNSSLEALYSGLPVIAYPQWGDQVTDAKFFVQVYKTGVRLHGPVKREALQSAVEEVLARPESKAIRERAEAMKHAAMKAVAGGGSSDKNIQAFVDELHARVSSSIAGVVTVAAGGSVADSAVQAAVSCKVSTVAE